MNDDLIISEQDDVISYTPKGKVLSLGRDTPSVDFHKTLGDIIRCFDAAKLLGSIKQGIQYVVQVPVEFQAGLTSGKYEILSGEDGRQWATLFEKMTDGKNRFVCNMPIKPEEIAKGNPIHDVSINMQMMAMQQQLANLAEMVTEVYETVQRIEQGQTDNRIGKLRAGKDGIEQAILIKDKGKRDIAFVNAQQLLLESRAQIGETLKTKVQSFPAIPKSQLKQFFSGLTKGNYFISKDKAFDEIQEYFQMYLLATVLLADSYYYCDEQQAAEKAYQDAIELVSALDFSNVKTLKNIHPQEDFSDSICELAIPYIRSEQKKSKALAEPYKTIELPITSEDIVEVLAHGKE